MDPVTKLKLISDDQVVGVAEVAALLGTTEGQVYKLSSQQPQCLPPRLKVFGRRLAWRRPDAHRLITDESEGADVVCANVLFGAGGATPSPTLCQVWCACRCKICPVRRPC